MSNYLRAEQKADIEHSKAAWERQAAQVFIKWYNSQFTQQLFFMKNNRPSKPDVSCLLGKEKLDIEIAHLYGTEQEAMAILGKALSAHTKHELSQMKVSSTAEQRLIIALNRILEQKSHKLYNSERTWLVIRNVHPRWDSDKIRAASNKIVLPNNHPFDQIWIIGDVNADSGALRI